jgi:hypothetical protein
MKILIVLGLAVTLTGCGWFDRHVVANVTGFSKTCVEGVTYLQFPSGVTPQYNPDGSLQACK